MQQTDALAQRYGTRPSILLGEADPYRAYCIDEACALAGQARESARTTTTNGSRAAPSVVRKHGILMGSFSREN